MTKHKTKILLATCGWKAIYILTSFTFETPKGKDTFVIKGSLLVKMPLQETNKLHKKAECRDDCLILAARAREPVLCKWCRAPRAVIIG